MDEIPEGFVAHSRKSPLTDPWEPLYARSMPDRLVLGVRVRTEHCNSRSMPHGGFLAALADNGMGLSVGMAGAVPYVMVRAFPASVALSATGRCSP